MIDEILQSRKKKHVKDLNIVPILDMLTTVIFFLLMSTSFMEYTKLTLPPASTVSSANTSNDPPLAPKLIVKGVDGGQFALNLRWGGKNPGQDSVTVQGAEVVKSLEKLLGRFKDRYQDEKTLQVSLGRVVPYQILIHVMDGARNHLPDVVLSSYMEAE